MKHGTKRPIAKTMDSKMSKMRKTAMKKMGKKKAANKSYGS